MQGSTVRARRERNTTAPLVAVVPIWIANGIVGAAMQVLVKVDIMYLKRLLLYRMLIVR